ncbi:signal peptidase I [Croceicoccus gelatinilyticus]|uniref:signal peptidase I n=1 Tax=Croceicoccus gelatinilyticus TaxID=2835536 RepID=UPI001BCA6970|nr:signal peptidase I [Croceicoccus gelatinilyticus]
MRADSQRHLKEGLLRIAKMVGMACVLTFLARSVLFAPYYVPSGSMMPALQVGDFFVASRFDFGVSPRSFVPSAPATPMVGAALPDRGDIVVFQNPKKPGMNIVKRVIGLPGDRLAMHDGQLFLNDQWIISSKMEDFLAPMKGVNCLSLPGIVEQNALNDAGEPACRFHRDVEFMPNGKRFATLDIAPAVSDEFAEIVVPDDHVFVLGDNRDDSLDSRYAIADGGVGFVPADRLVGKLRFVIGNNTAGARFIGLRDAFAR